MSPLFSPYAIGTLTLNNRIVIPPMCQYSASNGEAGDWHLIHLGQLVQSGAGLLIIEATAVEPEGRITPADLGLWSDETTKALEKVLRIIRKFSSMPIALQLAHAGRKASTEVPWRGGMQIPADAGGWQTIAPSALPFAEDEMTPTALDKVGLQRIIDRFVSAAQRAHQIGLDAIEIHAAHGYLLHEFLSPISNTRTDDYGGSLENRLRFPLAVFQAVKSAVASIPVGIRISATDWIDGGWDIEQSLVLAYALRDAGCSFMHVSSGGLSPAQKIPVGPDFQVPLAERIRRETGLPTISVGLILEPEQAEAIISEGRADLVAVGRGMLYNPRWPWHAAAKLGGQVEAPPQYWRSQPYGVNKLFGEGKFRLR